MDSFYITLVSDASGQLYPNNLITDFRNVLSHPVELQDNYEVALTECTYVNSSAIVLKGEVMINGEFNDSKDILPYHATRNIFNVQDVLDELNTIPPPYDYWSYSLSEKGELEAKENSKYQHPFALKLWRCIPKVCDIVYKPSLQILGKTQLFVYCDLIAPRRMADYMVPLLRTFEYKGKHNAIVNHEFEHRYYFPIKTERIEEIRCYIRHENGEPPSLNIQPFTATLHVRRRFQ